MRVDQTRILSLDVGSCGILNQVKPGQYVVHKCSHFLPIWINIYGSTDGLLSRNTLPDTEIQRSSLVL